ncbi:MAG: hypothetical protein KQH83_10835 [Actinobacteria bacterium]|jgi:catechol 2,3-dioxygenase-like lactoylglutathione lyase family enzyme|nr:hypothetical protein [Actinomycetota bacterium]
MDITAIGHLYVETLHWEASLRFWEGLGFTVAERWGSDGHRAGRLESGTAQIVLAEAPEGAGPAFDLVFRAGDLDGAPPAPEVGVAAPVQDTHWGTRVLRVRDPDGRVYSLEQDVEGG